MDILYHKKSKIIKLNEGKIWHQCLLRQHILRTDPRCLLCSTVSPDALVPGTDDRFINLTTMTPYAKTYILELRDAIMEDVLHVL